MAEDLARVLETLLSLQERLDALLRSKPESVDTLALKNELSVMRGQVDDLLRSLDKSIVEATLQNLIPNLYNLIDTSFGSIAALQ